MTLNGTNTIAYGFHPMTVNGGWDMPARKAPYVYDWGDSLEPLLTPTYAAWLPRVITVQFFYDPRTQTIGVGTSNWVDVFAQTYLVGSDITLGVTDKVGTIGEHTVRVKSIVKHKKYRGGNAKITVAFQEVSAAFNGTVPVSKSGGTFSIDGYSFGQFNAKLISTGGLSGLGELKPSKATTTINPKGLSAYRALNKFSLKLVIHSNDPISDLASLQKVLTGEAVLPFVYSGLSFDTFCGGSSKTIKKNGQTLIFDLNLFRL